MTRHGKNNTASSVYSYHERKLDTKTSGYGTQKSRLGKDSVKDFNACNLSLQPCRTPVITPDGYLYDKESLLEYVIHQKAENARKMRKYHEMKQKEENELKKISEKAKNERADKFSNQELNVFVEKNYGSETNAPSTSNMTNGRSEQLPSFWIPNLTPSSSKDKLKKPSKDVLCPMSGKPLKINQLIDITFTPVDPKISDPKKATYKCAVSHDVLSNSTKCVVLKTSGSVVTQECVDKFIRKDMIDPINGKPMKDSDFIPLQRGGTGYSLTNQVEAQVKKPVLMA